MQVTINSVKKYNEITPVYVQVYTCHYIKATKCDKYKINIGYDLLQGIFCVQSLTFRYVGIHQHFICMGRTWHQNLQQAISGFDLQV
jgi:hypothetical protein